MEQLEREELEEQDRQTEEDDWRRRQQDRQREEEEKWRREEERQREEEEMFRREQEERRREAELRRQAEERRAQEEEEEVVRFCILQSINTFYVTMPYKDLTEIYVI